MQQITTNTIAVGVDVHKYTHTAVALDCFGKELSSLEFSNLKLDEYVSWLNNLGEKENLLIGLEDTSANGLHISKTLDKEKFSYRHVPPVLTERERQKSVKRDKSDRVDAKRVGKVILNKYEETLPATNIVTKKVKDTRAIDLLIQERDSLVRDQTELKNQMHSLLHQHYGDEYKKGFYDIFCMKALMMYEDELTKEKGYITKCILRKIQKLRLIAEQIKEINKEIVKISKTLKEVKILESIQGCGNLTACRIIVEIKDITRFPSSDHLASYAGIAPIDRSSGRSKRVITNSGGNRKLNRAIYIIALTQIGNRGYTPGREYYQKKKQEGKTSLWALRCLKRQVIKRIYNQLIEV